jgi:hypothetical protein
MLTRKDGADMGWWRIWLGVVLVAWATASRGDDVAVAGNGNGNGAGVRMIEIWKGKREMELRDGDQVVRRFKVVLGTSPREPKQVQGDNRTPVGDYYVSDKNDRSRFRRFLGLSYPNVEDAERGYAGSLIDVKTWADIFFANLRRDRPPSSTRLGGRVGIHGFGGRPEMPIDWTQGCIAVTDAEIDYLFARVPIGTPVTIHE